MQLFLVPPADAVLWACCQGKAPAAACEVLPADRQAAAAAFFATPPAKALGEAYARLQAALAAQGACHDAAAAVAAETDRRGLLDFVPGTMTPNVHELTAERLRCRDAFGPAAQEHAAAHDAFERCFAAAAEALGKVLEP